MTRHSSLLKAAVLACALLALKDLAFVGPAESPKLRRQEVRTARPEPGRVALEEGGAEQAISRDVPKALLAFASGFTPAAAAAYTTAEEALRPWYSIAPWYGGALYVVTLIIQRVQFRWYNYAYVAAATLWLAPAILLWFSYKFDPANNIPASFCEAFPEKARHMLRRSTCRHLQLALTPQPATDRIRQMEITKRLRWPISAALRHVMSENLTEPAATCDCRSRELLQRCDSVPRCMFTAARVSGAASLPSELRLVAHSFAGERPMPDLLDLDSIGPPPGLSRDTGANKESWSTSDEGDECFWCRCCHNGRMKPDKKQREAVKSISEAQLLDLLLAQLSMRAQQAGRFDTLFPVLQAIHCRLSFSSKGKSDISGAALRNMEKMMSKMSCQQMVFFADKNPNVDGGIMQLVKDQLRARCPAAPLGFSGSSARSGQSPSLGRRIGTCSLIADTCRVFRPSLATALKGTQIESCIWALFRCHCGDSAIAIESFDIETRVQNGRNGSKERTVQKESEKIMPKPSADQEAHVLGAWLQDASVLELLNFHQDAKKNGKAINTSTKSHFDVLQMNANGKGT
ncbi:hypothetical protein AK812_SmicGene2477 [Symbiodinium microadriaticum]|uniref:Uncharacterized protein n=1 Tax=Symbiodinium microadriaticum TaxID=2951 RepID=A0A1Q9F1G4_SYMMI|nr:hypothetical protein AK812_SmicGene2477 [Symbiodinium microadriaticum]